MYSSPATPIGTGCAAAIEDVELRVGDRPADRHRRSIAPSTRCGRRPDRRLGRPVHVEQRRRRRARAAAAPATAGSASPPTSMRRSRPAPRATRRRAASIAASDGVHWRCVTPWRRSARRRRVVVFAGRRARPPSALPRSCLRRSDPQLRCERASGPSSTDRPARRSRSGRRSRRRRSPSARSISGATDSGVPNRPPVSK